MQHRVTLIGLLIITIALAGCTSTPAPNPNITPIILPDPSTPLHQHQIFQQYATSRGITPQETTQFFQTTYGISEEGIYSQLPTPAATFFQDVNTLHYGNGIEINTIPAESYLQPEFFPTFTTSGIKTWIEAPTQFPNTFGFSSTPAEQQATLAEDSNGFTTTLFIGSAWGVTYYQGMAFRYTIIPQADIQLTFDPPHILAGPTFPAFTPEWMHKITINGNIGAAVPAGTYTISIFPADAPIEVQNEWYSQHPRYINGNGLIGPANGLATLTLTIPPRNTSN